MSPSTVHSSTDLSAHRMPVGPQAAAHAARILIIDSAQHDASPLQDALDEAGYTVVVATGSDVAVALAVELPPDVILLAARLSGAEDGFSLAKTLRDHAALARTPLLFMLDPDEPAHLAQALAAGGIGHLVWPVRPLEALERIGVLLQEAQARRKTMDAYGHAAMAVREKDGRCLWHTPLARALMADYFTGEHFERGRVPPEVLLWLHREALRRLAGGEPSGLTVLPQRPADAKSARAMVARSAKRLSFTLQAADAEALGEGQWMIIMREADDAPPREAQAPGP